MELHIVDDTDECLDNDSGSFPIDLQSGSFPLTNAEFMGLFADKYVVRATMTAPNVCANTENPPGSGIKKVCTTAADCDPGDSCVAAGRPWDWIEKIFGWAIPTLSEWAAVVLTLVLLTGGTIVFRRGMA